MENTVTISLKDYQDLLVYKNINEGNVVKIKTNTGFLYIPNKDEIYEEYKQNINTINDRYLAQKERYTILIEQYKEEYNKLKEQLEQKQKNFKEKEIKEKNYNFWTNIFKR